MPREAWLVIALAVVFVGGLLILMALPARITIEAGDAALLVRLRGLDPFWCVRRTVAVAWSDIASIAAADRGNLPKAGMRLPGAYMPGVIMAGSYGLGQNRTFWDIRRGARLLVITCRPGTAYRHLVLEVADPDGAANRLRVRLRPSP
jgi:hypothetical protein